MSGLRSAPVLALALGFAALSARAQEPFALQQFARPGRVVAADLADLDGDGFGDLFLIEVDGSPTAETRTLRVHFGRAGGQLPSEADLALELPAPCAAYDHAPLDARPGAELLFLERGGVAVLRLSGRVPSWSTLPVPEPPTMAVLADERGLDRLRLYRPSLDGLLVPGLGQATVLDPEGAVRGLLPVGGRANFFVPKRPGPVVGEGEMELYFDSPRLDVGDVDGDGRADVVAMNRHELRLFRQRPDASFPVAPDQRLAVGLLTQEETVRNTGSVRIALVDLDGDPRADLLVTHVSGGLMKAVTRTRLHRNRAGSWKLDAPDQVFENEGALATDLLVDLDGDGAVELGRVVLPLGILELAEVFLQREIDAEASIHRRAEGGGFDPEPWYRGSFGLGFDFSTTRTKGFIPTLEADVNGDGQLDLLSSADGKALEVYLGGPKRRLARRDARQAMDTAGRIRFGELDGDGLVDIVLYDPRRPDAPVRVGHNRGRMPGTAPSFRAPGG